MQLKIRSEFLIHLFIYLTVISADRLYLQDGGYARVVRLQQYPLSSFTLSGWVNVTSFPEGISPFLTYLSQDVNSQISFFIRPEGIGILWGGPNVEEDLPDESRIDRRPRLYPSNDGSKRRKREAIDYSAGLGDIENILTKRSMKADDNWAPSNFVDVDTMGVYDLMLSGSDADEVVEEVRDPRAQAYSQWTNVPYELHMAESEPEEKVERKEPRIITQPSGKDDFVYINWNVPASRRNIPLGGNNWSPLWEPTKENQAPDVNIQPNLEPKTNLVPTKKAANPSNSPKLWVTEGEESVKIEDKWHPTITNINFFDYPKAETKLLPTKYERPIWPLTLSEQNQQESQNTAIPISTVSFETTVPTIDSNILFDDDDNNNNNNNNNNKITPSVIKLEGIQIGGTPPSISTPDNFFPRTTTKINQNTNPRTTRTYTSSTRSSSAYTTTDSTTTTTTTTTTPKSETTTTQESLFKLKPGSRRNVIPSSFRHSNKEKEKSDILRSLIEENLSQSPKRSRTRVPLWKLIKKPSKDGQENTQGNKNYETSEKELVPDSSGQIYQSIPSSSSSTTTKTTTMNNSKLSIPEPTLPPIKSSNDIDRRKQLLSSRRNLYRSRPVQIPSISRRTTTTKVTSTSTTPLPTTSTRKIPYRPTPITHKVPNYQGSKIDSPVKPKLSLWERKQYTTESSFKPSLPKINQGKYDNRRSSEFEKAMKNPKLIKEGNTAVVYAVPITNEKEFYEMYKKYQKDSVSPYKSKMNLHDLYNEMRTGGINKNKNKKRKEEDEYNENRLRFSESSVYKESLYPIIEPTVTVQTSTTEVTPPPIVIKETVTKEPSRSDIPIEDYEETIEENENQIETDKSQVQESDQNNEEPKPEEFPVYDEQVVADYLENHFYDYYNNEDFLNNDDTSSTSEIKTDNEEPLKEVHYIPEIQDNDETLADLYKPKGIVELSSPQINPSYYQEPQKLSYEQLPPNYEKFEKQYDFKNPKLDEPILEYKNQEGVHRVSDTYDERVTFDSLPPETNPIYKTNAFEFISEDLIPKPIHKEETIQEIWEPNYNTNDQINGQSPTNLQANDIQLIGDEISQDSVAIPGNRFQFPLTNPVVNDQVLPAPPIPEVQNENGLLSDKAPLDIPFETIPYPFAENVWYHLTFAWSGSTKKATVYVNGEQVGTIENVLMDKEQLEEGGLFLLGKTLLPDLSDFDETSQFQGEMSNVNLWATELPPHSVDSLFQCKYDPRYPQPIDWEKTQFKLYESANMTFSPPLCGLIT